MQLQLYYNHQNTNKIQTNLYYKEYNFNLNNCEFLNLLSAMFNVTIILYKHEIHLILEISQWDLVQGGPTLGSKQSNCCDDRTTTCDLLQKESGVFYLLKRAL
eukprot:TRINITY_DN6807_c0_g2_i1.p5 TRINITY_DN6807_c0_g2~~TRINITY_DN6807_c0_g2_i1.p5  ORF type:complete len:103 (+),score=0.46 TRINITY_DN6807_c0_g2_i1:588-896(+)